MCYIVCYSLLINKVILFLNAFAMLVWVLSFSVYIFIDSKLSFGLIVGSGLFAWKVFILIVYEVGAVINLVSLW